MVSLRDHVFLYSPEKSRTFGDMCRPEHTAFYQEVYEIVSQIPSGKVITYGDIAALTGFPARL